MVLVHFFATWCEPCREELPSLGRLASRSDPARLKVVAVSVAEVDVRVRSFVEKVPVPYPVLLDRDRAVARAWGVSALPTSFVVGPDRRPRLHVEHDVAWDGFDAGSLAVDTPSATVGSTGGTDQPSPISSGGETR